MEDKAARDLYRGMCGMMYVNESRRAVGEFADDAHLMTLAQHVIEAIDALPAQTKTLLHRKQLAEAVIAAYQPLPSKPASEPRAYTVMDAAFVLQ